MKKSEVALVVVVAAVLVIGGLFLFQKATSAPGCAGEAPCMVYFYADW